MAGSSTDSMKDYSLIQDDRRPSRHANPRRVKDPQGPPPEEFDQGGTCELYESDRLATRKKTIIIGVALIIVTLFSLCLGYTGAGTGIMRYSSPVDVAKAIGTAIYLGIGHLFNLAYIADENQIISSLTVYHEVIDRLGVTYMTLVCGLMLSVSGMLFQNVFKNPIASPSMLGVSSGVQIGLLLLVAQFGTAAASYLGLKYVYCYIGGCISLFIVLIIGKATSGKKKGGFNIVNMIVVGAMFSQLIGIGTSFMTTRLIHGDLWLVYYQLSEGLTVNMSPAAFAFVTVTAIVTIIPIASNRFGLNLLAFSDEEMKLGGLDSTKARTMALICGSLMILASQVEIGTIAVVSLVVPFLARAVFGSEFRKQLVGTILIGMLLVLVCRDISAMIPFVGDGISMGTIANIITVPLFAWIIASNQKLLS